MKPSEMKTLILSGCLLVLSGCASTPQSNDIRANGLSALPPAVELTDTPFYPQTQYQCGPAALATVLQAHHIQATPETLSSQVYIPDRQGSLQIEMTVAARRHEMLPYPLAPQMTAIFSEIAAGNPVLVLQNLGFEWYPKWHYAVVVGYDYDNQEITLRSGTTKRWTTPFNVFERTWQRADFWALVIVPVGNIPETAKPLRYLKAAYAFEETGNNKLALKAYRAASKRWPGNAITWVTLGNIEYKNRNFPEAITAFNNALSIEPEAVTSWNNLAYALHAYGCRKQSKKALQCGLKIAPQDENLQASQLDLTQIPINKEPSDCPIIHCY